MKRAYHISLCAFFLTAWWIILHPNVCFALEEMSERAMDRITGQAGVSIFLTTTVVQRSSPTDIVYDTLGGSIELRNSNLTLTLATHNKTFDIDVGEHSGQTTFTDTWSGGSQDYVVDHPLDGYTMVTSAIDNLTFQMDATAGEILFNDVSIGELEMSNLNVDTARLDLFATDEVGVRGAFQTRMAIDRIAYTYDTERSIDGRFEQLQINNAKIAGSFGGDPLPSYFSTVNPGDTIDTGTWTSEDYFKLGSTEPVWSFSFVDDPLVEGDPIPTASSRFFSLDLRADPSPYIPQKFNIDWQGNYNLDPDGYIGDGSSSKPYIVNARHNKVYLDAMIPIEGSIRFEALTREWSGGPATTMDLGPAAIDGINGWVSVQAPGYGIGNSPIPPYYD